MTREWKPDDEALVRVRVVPGDEPNRLHVQVAGGAFAAYVKPEQLIKPGVVISGLRREDAAVLVALGNGEAHNFAQARGIALGIASAIRAQTPEPEPPPRWTVAPSGALTENGRLFRWTPSEVQRLADALNAAEPTP